MNAKRIPQVIYKVAVPVAFIVLGALLLFVPAIQSSIFVYLFGAALIISGAAVTVQYFTRQLYKTLASNDFTFGVFMTILGVCILIGAKKIADSVTVLLGVCLLLSAVMKLQSVIQFKLAGSKLWIPVLVLSVAVVACAMVILIATEWEKRNVFTYVTMIADGAISIFTNIFLYFILKKRFKESAKSEETALPPVEI